MREKHVSEKNAERVAPACVHGRLGTPPLGIVHDVVVHEGREMDQFNDDCQIQMPRNECTHGSTAQERNQWTQAFAATADRISNITLDRWIKGGGLGFDSAIDLVELRLHWGENATQRTGHHRGRSG